MVKRWVNTIMNLSGCPASAWYLCSQYGIHVVNHLASPTLKGQTPLQALTGQTPDISHLMYFQFWEPIYFKIDKEEPDYAYPSLSNEQKGRWVDFGDHFGDHLT